MRIISKTIQNQPKVEQSPVIESPTELPNTGETANTQTEQFEAVTPAWMVWGSSIGVALFFTGLVALGLWLYYRRHVKQLEPSERLAHEAGKAISALQSGEDFKNVIIRCYYQMSEFEQALEEKGFPKEPIHYLTKIFEEVRYGTKRPAKQEEDKAIWYLSVIADASKNNQLGSQA